MMVKDKEYQNHAVFAELERYGEFYRELGGAVFGFTSIGTQALCNIDSYVFSSIQGTLASIKSVLRDGRINDAYALLRKYHDSAVINIYTNLYLEAHVSVESFVVKHIDDWLHGKEKLPEFRVMSQYLRAATKLAPVTALLFKDDHYKNVRDRCNDHTHYNFYSNVLLNDSEIHLPERRVALEQFSNDLRDLFVFHTACLFFACDHYMKSSDHVDCLEMGLTPEPDSQYWVAPFVQEIFDDPLKKFRPDIAQVIKRHTPMQLA